MAIKHLIAKGLGFSPASFVVTEGLGDYSSSPSTDDCIFDSGIFDTGIFDHCSVTRITGGGHGGRKRYEEPALIAPFIKWNAKKKKPKDEPEPQPLKLKTEPVGVETPLLPARGPALVAPADYDIFLQAYSDNRAEIDSLYTVQGQMQRLLEIIEEQMAEQDDEDVLTLLLN